MKHKAPNALEFKDLLLTDLEDGGDGTEVIWKAIGKPTTTPWLVFESYQRAIFQLYAGNTLNERQALILLSELLGAATGRGVGF